MLIPSGSFEQGSIWRRRPVLYTQTRMPRRALLLLILAAALCSAAQIPRKSPEFVIEMGPDKQLLVSQYRGKVLCLVFILTN